MVHVTDNTLLQNNNKIPLDMECTTLKIKNQIYNNFCFYIAKFINGVKIDGLTVRN